MTRTLYDLIIEIGSIAAVGGNVEEYLPEFNKEDKIKLVHAAKEIAIGAALKNSYEESRGLSLSREELEDIWNSPFRPEKLDPDFDNDAKLVKRDNIIPIRNKKP